MCAHGDRIDGIDSCIAPLIKILNDNGMKTLKSCCGHGETDGFILGRDFMLIVPIEYSNGKHFDRYEKDFSVIAESFSAR